MGAKLGLTHYGLNLTVGVGEKGAEEQVSA